MKLSCSSLLLSCLVASSVVQSDVTCKNGVYVVVARASLEPPGYGVLAVVKNLLISVIPDSDSVAVPYPASLLPPVNYVDSEPEGVGNATELIKQYAAACPGHQMVLMGYSQGAQVIADTLIGSSYDPPSFPTTEGLPQSIIDNNVLAVILMGDPSNVANQPFLIGNSTNSGTFPRNNTENWTSKNLINKTVSYCDAQDTYCDSGTLGGISLAIHATYVSSYGAQAANYVNQRWRTYSTSSSSSSEEGGGSTPSGTGTGTGEATSSATPPPNNAIRSSSNFVVAGLIQFILAMFFVLVM